VTLREFKAGVPPLGPNGEAAKEYIFARVDSLVDGNNKLDTQVRGPGRGREGLARGEGKNLKCTCAGGRGLSGPRLDGWVFGRRVR
jgi:hypothetical protein